MLVKANRGFESLPVRSASKDRVFNLPEAKLGWAYGKQVPIPPCPNEFEDRESHHPEGKIGWHRDKSKGRAPTEN